LLHLLLQFKNEKSFVGNEIYYWFKFSGHYFYSIQSFEQATIYYLKAERELGHVEHFQEEEKADLFYSISIAGSKQYKVAHCIEYGNIALEIYQKLYNYKQCVKCLILLGATYNRIKLYDKSITCLKTATSLAKTMSNKKLLF
jgi:HTH-type transcriptional regulator, quorum sensing regulator NprR